MFRIHPLVVVLAVSCTTFASPLLGSGLGGAAVNVVKRSTPALTTIYATSTLSPGYYITTTTSCSSVCPPVDNSGNALIQSSNCGTNCLFCRWNWPGGNHFAQYRVVRFRLTTRFRINVLRTACSYRIPVSSSLRSVYPPTPPSRPLHAPLPPRPQLRRLRGRRFMPPAPRLRARSSPRRRPADQFALNWIRPETRSSSPRIAATTASSVVGTGQVEIISLSTTW